MGLDVRGEGEREEEKMSSRRLEGGGWGGGGGGAEGEGCVAREGGREEEGRGSRSILMELEDTNGAIYPQKVRLYVSREDHAKLVRPALHENARR